MNSPLLVRAKSNALALEAMRWIGVRETSVNAGWAVEKFQKAVDGKAGSEAWCMCFVQFCVRHIDELGSVLGIGLDFRTALHESEHCLTVWNRTPAMYRQKKPEAGSIVIWQHYTVDNVATMQGHAGIVTAVGRDGFQSVEGNTNSGDAVVREGDGVYLRARSFANSGPMHVKGFLSAW